MNMARQFEFLRKTGTKIKHFDLLLQGARLVKLCNPIINIYWTKISILTFMERVHKNLKQTVMYFIHPSPMFVEWTWPPFPWGGTGWYFSSVCGYQSMYQHLLHLHLLWRLFLCLIIYSWLLQKQFHSIWKKIYNIFQIWLTWEGWEVLVEKIPESSV